MAQRNPDGSAYEPRKKRELRGKQGRIRRKIKMFQKLLSLIHILAPIQGTIALSVQDADTEG